jgi:hypothetical protein
MQGGGVRGMNRIVEEYFVVVKIGHHTQITHYIEACPDSDNYNRLASSMVEPRTPAQEDMSSNPRWNQTWQAKIERPGLL